MAESLSKFFEEVFKLQKIKEDEKVKALGLDWIKTDP